MEYLRGADGRTIVGRYEKRGSKFIVYDKDDYIRLGYYDSKDDRTYDAYGNCVSDGDASRDLQYYIHEIKFPLPEMARVSFTKCRIERIIPEGNHRSSMSGFYDDFWDNGKCDICRKNHPTCHVSGFPFMCETCYRFMRIYGNTDTLGLVRESKQHAISLAKFKKAVELAKAPYLEAAKDAEMAFRANLIQGIRNLDFTGENNASINNNNHRTQTSIQRKEGDSTQTGQKTKKKGISLLGWLVIVFIVIPIVFNLLGLVFALIVIAITGNWDMFINSI